MLGLFVLFILILHIVFLYNGFVSIRSARNLLNIIQEVNPKDMEFDLPIGISAPGFKLMDASGREISYGTLPKQPTIMLVVANGCSSCSIDKVEFEKASKKYSNFNFLMIKANYSAEEMTIDFPDHGENFYVLYSNEQFLGDYGIKFYPSYIALNTNREIVGYPIVIEHIENYLPALQ
jgi:peroxiredoxin